MSETSFIFRVLKSRASYIKYSSSVMSSISSLLISFLIMIVSLSKRNVEGIAAFKTSPIGVK